MKLLPSRSGLPATVSLLNLLWYLVIADIGVVAISSLVVIIWGTFLLPNPVEGDFIKLLALGDGLQLTLKGLHTPALLGLYYAVRNLISLCIAAVVIFQIKNILTTLRTKNLFNTANEHRLQWIGAAFFLGGLAHAGVNFLIGLLLEKVVLTNQFHIKARFELNWMLVAIGLILWVLAAAFRQGTELQQAERETV